MPSLPNINPQNTSETDEIIHTLTMTIMVTPHQAKRAASLIQRQQDTINQLHEDIQTLITAVKYGWPPTTWGEPRKTLFNQNMMRILQRHDHTP